LQLGFERFQYIGLNQCFSTFLLQWNLPQMFALLMEPYATVKQWYCYYHIELWLRISSQAIWVSFGGTVAAARGTEPQGSAEHLLKSTGLNKIYLLRSL